MASTSLQVAGLASNFDWKSFVDSIMELERAPADRLEREKSTNSQKVNLMSTLGTKLTALQTSAQALGASSLYAKRSVTSDTTGSTWGATAAADTAAGSYKIAVSQLATAATLKGNTDVGKALNPTDDDVSGLTLANLPIGQAVTAGTFTVNGKQVTVALTDSLQDVFDAIETATGGDVTGVYNHTTDKITLASATTTVTLGAANDSSNFLRALKLGNNGTGTVTSSGKLGGVKTAAALSAANLAGTVTDGAFTINGVSISYAAGTDTLTSVLKKINDSTAGVSASYDALNDRVVLANKTTGDVGIAVADTSGGLMTALKLTSGTTFTRGDNAEFTIDGGDVISSASNTLDASAHGIAGLSVTVRSETTETFTVAADKSAMRSKLEAFIEDFNDVQDYIDSVTKVSTDAKGKVTAAALSGNREIQDWARSMRSLAFDAVSGMTGDISRLNSLGLDFIAGTSKLEIEDGAKLDAALADSTVDVAEFFATEDTGFAARLETFLAGIGERNTEAQERLNKSNTGLDDQIAAIERRLEQQRQLMESAFIAMETAQSKIKQQQSAVENMFVKPSSS